MFPSVGQKSVCLTLYVQIHVKLMSFSLNCTVFVMLPNKFWQLNLRWRLWQLFLIWSASSDYRCEQKCVSLCPHGRVFSVGVARWPKWTHSGKIKLCNVQSKWCGHSQNHVQMSLRLKVHEFSGVVHHVSWMTVSSCQGKLLAHEKQTNKTSWVKYEATALVYQWEHCAVQFYITNSSHDPPCAHSFFSVMSFQLFCSMSATFTLNFFRSGINFNKWGSFQLPGLLNFGEFKVKSISLTFAFIWH